MKDNVFEKDYLTIAEFAEIVETTASSLRHYEKMKIFSAAKRGKEEDGQYRYYNPMQITLFNMIRVLSDINMPIKEIQNISDCRTPDVMLKLLTNQRYELLDKKTWIEETISVVSTYIEMLYHGMSAAENKITVSMVPEMRIAMGGINNFTDSNGFYREFIRFCKAPRNPPISLSYPIGGYFESMDAYIANPSEPTKFYSLDPKGNDMKESGLHMIGYTRGYYGETNDVISRMMEYAKKHGYIFSGPVYNLFLFDEVSVSDPNQYLLQVSAAVYEAQEAFSRKNKSKL